MVREGQTSIPAGIPCNIARFGVRLSGIAARCQALFRLNIAVSRFGERMKDIDADRFETLVIAELDLLPDEMVADLENLVFITEDRPEDGSLDLLGLYDGVDLAHRSDYGFGELPDRIILYREPLLAVSADLAELKDQIHVTLVHEIAHYYGIDDNQLHNLGWG